MNDELYKALSKGYADGIGQLNALDRIEELEDALRSILEIPNSEAAAGIMTVFARTALEHKEQ